MSDVEQSEFTLEDYGQLVEYGWIDSRRTAKTMIDDMLGRLDSRYFAREWPEGISMALENPPLVANRWVHGRESTKAYRPAGTGSPKRYNVSENSRFLSFLY